MEKQLVGCMLRGGSDYEDLFFDGKHYFVENDGKKEIISRETLRFCLQDYWEHLSYDFDKGNMILTSIVYDGVELWLFGKDNTGQNDEDIMFTRLVDLIMDIALGKDEVNE